MLKPLESPLLGTLIGLNLLAILVVAASYVMPLPDDVASVGTAEASSGTQRNAAVRTAEIDTALARPLFHANRMPPQAPEIVEEVEAAPVRIEAPYQLAGVMGSASNRTAYLQHQQTQETVAVAEGDTVGAWNVDTIGTNFVTLTQGEERRVIQLADGG